MKKVFYILLICVFMIALLCPVTVSAEDTPNTSSEAVEAAPEGEENPTIFSRIYEAFTDNKSDIYTIAGSIGLLIVSLILKKDVGASSKTIVGNIANVLAKTDLSTERQEKIVGGLNEMIDGYEEIKKHSDAVTEKMSEFAAAISNIEQSNKAVEDKLAEAVNLIISLLDKEILQNAEVMEVLASVYSGNKVLPQGIKDFVSLKRTENAQLVKEAEALIHPSSEGGEAK